MAVTHTPIFSQTIKNGAVQILPADTTTLKTIFTAGSDGAIVNNLMIHSTDSSAKDVLLYVTFGGIDSQIGTISVPANSGNTNALPMIAAFAHANLVLNTDVNGNKILWLESGAILKAKVSSTVTTAKAITFFAQAGNY